MYLPITDWRACERTVDKKGYVRILVPDHPRSFCEGWVYEHKLVIERDLSSLVPKGMTIHHINENKQDNRLCNLFVCSSEQHIKAHGRIVCIERLLRVE